MDFRHWYAIFVMTGEEERVKQRIEQQLVRRDVEASLFVPKRLLRERKDGVVTEAIKVMFPGYVLVGTNDIDRVSDAVVGVHDVIRLLKNGKEYQEIELSEISRLIYWSDEDGIIGELEVCLDKDSNVVVLSGPLKGEEGWITKLNKRKGRIAVNILIGSEWHEIWLSAKLVDKTKICV